LKSQTTKSLGLKSQTTKSLGLKSQTTKSVVPMALVRRILSIS
jgi:hypothetical protein